MYIMTMRKIVKEGVEMFRDATSMAQAVRDKQVSPLELVLETIEKAERLNPRLNAIVSTRYEEAIEEAKKFQVNNQPFAGVPLFLKDLGQEKKGTPCTYGSRLFKDYICHETSHFVKRLEELGFIILGRTNTPEFGYKMVSDAQLHGPVRHFLDETVNAGGSSGGAAAIVAAGISPMSAASDGGGSIRVPASHNGLIGLKPTRGRVPVGPGSYRGWNGATVQFGLTKTVRDTRNMLWHLQTCQLESPFPLPLLQKENLFSPKINRPLKVGMLLKHPIGGKVSSEVEQVVRQMAKKFEVDGHEVSEIVEDPINGIELQKGFYLISGAETVVMFQKMEKQLQRQMTRFDMELMTWVMYQSGLMVTGADYARVAGDWDRYAEAMMQLHDTYDVLLLPTVANTAPKQDAYSLDADLIEKMEHIHELSHEERQEVVWKMFESSVEDTPFTQRMNITGQPAISLPVGHSKEGMPIGVQLVAAKGREDLLLMIAEQWEQDELWKF